MKQVLMLLMLVGMMGCGNAKFQSLTERVIPKSCDAEIDHLVMEKVSREIPDYNGVSVQYSPSECSDLDNTKAKISKLEKWSSSLSDRCVSDAYSHWLRFFDGQLGEARQECTSHEKQKEYEEYVRKTDAEDRKVEEYRQKHVIPEPPK